MVGALFCVRSKLWRASFYLRVDGVRWAWQYCMVLGLVGGAPGGRRAEAEASYVAGALLVCHHTLVFIFLRTRRESN